jgi:hypothetical protein
MQPELFTRKTSRDVYHQIKAEGLLSKMRMEVLAAIYLVAPCTSAEAFAVMIKGRNPLSQSRARFTELREWGVIKEIGVRKCKITGRKVIEWDLTGDLPVKPVKDKKVIVISVEKAEQLLHKYTKNFYSIINSP